MLLKIKNSRFKEALFIGVFFFFLSFPLSKYSEGTVNQGFNDVVNFFLFAISAIIIAPILEEFTFRSFLSKNQKYFGLALFLLTLFALSSFYTYVSHGILGLLTVGSIFYHRKTQTKLSTWILICLSSIYFAQSHYSAEYNLESFLNFAYAQLGLGFIFAWIVTNFKLKHSMIAHAIINGSLCVFLFLLIQFVLEPNSTIENEQVEIHFEQIPYINDFEGSKITIDSTWRIENSSISEAINLIKVSHKDSLSTIKSNIPFSKYNILIRPKSDDSIHYNDVYQLLIEHGLVIRKGK